MDPPVEPGDDGVAWFVFLLLRDHYRNPLGRRGGNNPRLFLLNLLTLRRFQQLRPCCPNCAYTRLGDV